MRSGPTTLDYVQMLFTHFEELHGDRASPTTPRSSAAWRASATRPAWSSATRKAAYQGEDPAQLRHAQAEGYRKALRLMKLAENSRAGVHFVDTQAPTRDRRQERGQSEAIGRNLFEMARLRTPIIVSRDRPRAARAARSPSRWRRGADAANRRRNP